jgi:hypothetical protein
MRKKRTNAEIREAIRQMESVRDGAMRHRQDPLVGKFADTAIMSATGILKALEWVLGDDTADGFGAMLTDMDKLDKLSGKELDSVVNSIAERVAKKQRTQFDIDKAIADAEAEADRLRRAGLMGEDLYEV